MTDSTMDWRRAAIDIWRAGVNAVDSSRLVAACLTVDGTRLCVDAENGTTPIIHDFGADGRLLVVGAGKAGAGMAEGVERVLAGTPLESRIRGWINVPADCVRPTRAIHLHPARPPGLNEPTLAGVRNGSHSVVGGGSGSLGFGARAHFGRRERAAAGTGGRGFVGRKTACDTAVVVARGRHPRIEHGAETHFASEGGRVVAGREVPDRVARHLGCHRRSARHHRVRPHRSRLVHRRRGTGGSRALRSGWVDTPPAIVEELRRQRARESSSAAIGAEVATPIAHNRVIGNNKVACDAAVAEANRLGFDTRLVATDQAGVAEEVGRDLARLAVRARDEGTSEGRPVCLVSGGEPIVRLAQYAGPRKGGRNQQLVLAALLELGSCEGITLLSGGTDGEDGPTDAAGAVVDADVVARGRAAGLDPSRIWRSTTHTHTSTTSVALCARDRLIPTRWTYAWC